MLCPRTHVTNDGKIILAGASGTTVVQSVALARFYSGLTIGIQEPLTADFQLDLFPNPVGFGSLTLNYELQQATALAISLKQADGRLASKIFDGMRSSGKHQEEITLPYYLSAGIYFIELASAAGTCRIQFVVTGK